MTVKPTHQHTRGSHYRKPGGAWSGSTLHELLIKAAGASGSGATAVVDGDVRLSFDDVDRLAARLAGGLHHAGVRRRDVVAWQLINGFESVLLFRACWRIGAIAVPFHERATAAEIEPLLGALAPKVVVGATNLPLGAWPKAYVIGGAALPARSRTDRSPAHHPPAHETHDFATLLGADPAGADAARSSDLAVILPALGPDEPSGVLHTHRSLAYKAQLLPDTIGLRPADAVLVAEPLASVGGLLDGLLVAGAAGATCVLLPRWNAVMALDLIEHERVSYLASPPTVLLGLLESRSFTRRRVRSVRVASVVGTNVSRGFVRRAEDALDAKVRRSYGSAEAPDAWSTDDDDRAVPVGEVESRVVDPETGKDQPEGTEGEVWLRGPELFSGYLDPERTKAAFARGGWYRTGDLGVLDPRVGLDITGRVRDIRVRGEQFSVASIEAVLEEHPRIRSAAAIGFPDDLLGECIAVFVVARGSFDLATCHAWFAEQGVDRLHWPEQVQTVLSMPTLASGKIDRQELRSYLL